MKSAGLPEVVTTEELANLLGVDGRTVRNLVARGVVTRVGRGRHNLAEAIRAVVADAKRPAARGVEGEARAAFLRARAEDVATRTAERRRDLIPLADAQDDLSELVGMFVTSLENIPARMTRDVLLRQRLEAEVFNIRMELANKAKEIAERFGGVEAR